MAEIGVDTSSYPKPSLPVSPLDVAGKLGGLQSQSLQINQQKLSQANEALTYLTRAMSAIGPDGTKDQYKRAGMDAVNAGLVPKEMLGIWTKKIDDAPDTKSFYNEAMTAAADHGAMFQYHLGAPSAIDTGQRKYIGQVPLAVGSQPTIRGSIPIEAPPTSEQTNLGTGQKSTIGNVAAPPTQGFTNRLNVAPLLPTGAMDPNSVPGMRPGERAISAQVQPATGSFPTAPPPGFEEGLKQYTADQDLATGKMTALKPLLLALPKMKDLRSGPGTETFNNAVAFLKANGILSTAVDGKDPTQVYQEVNKYMNQYVSRNGTRSDADLASREMSNPNVKTQINPALVELTQNTIAQDRIEAARPGAFESKNYSQYGSHRSQFPQNASIDAAKFDLLPKTERVKTFNEQLKKAQAGDKGAIKFIKTLDTMRKQNMHDLAAD